MIKVGQYVRYKPELTTEEGQLFVYVVQSMDDAHNTVTMVCINPVSSDNPSVTVSMDSIEKVWDDENVPSWVWIDKSKQNGGKELDTVFSEFYHEYIKPDETTVQYDDDSTTCVGTGAITGNRYLLTYDINGEYIDDKTRKL